MRRPSLLIALLALSAGCAGLPQHAPDRLSPAQLRAGGDRLIVVAVDNADLTVSTRAGGTPRGYDALPVYAESSGARTTLAALAQDYGVHEVAGWPIPQLHWHCVVFEIPAETSPKAMLERMTQDPRVRLAQPLQQFGTLGGAPPAYDDPYLGLQRGFAAIHAAEAQQWSRGRDIRVAIVDTGLDVAHPDLRGRVTLYRNFVDADIAQFNHDRHGTEVAGVIAAVANNGLGIVGVAPDAEILAFKACWQLRAEADGAQCNSFTLAQALSAAMDAGAQVINLSLGGPPDPLLSRLIEEGLAQGVIFVGAMPPDGDARSFPVGIPGVIAVDAAERTSAGGLVVRAPGVDILTLAPDGHYDFASGSSLAAAHVSGIVALLLAQNPHADVAAIRSQLAIGESSGRKIIDACAALAPKAQRSTCGAGPALSQHTQTAKGAL